MSTKFDNLWELMSQYTFETDPDSINDDLTCTICKKLMIDACQTVCGCQFCTKCISDYLNNGKKYCPGGKDACTEEFLVFERDIMKNIRMNNRISKLQVICPNELCQYKSNLSQMEDHLRICRVVISICPYAALGCDKLLNHICNDPFIHTDLIVDSITNLRNEVDGLKDRLEASEVEKMSLREKSKASETEMAKKILKQEKEMINLKAELKKKMDKITSLESKSTNQENIIFELKAEFIRIRTEIESRLSLVTVQMEKREKNFVTRTDSCKKFEKDKTNIASAEENSYSSDSFSYRQSNVVPSNRGYGFLWTIEQISLHKNTIFSDGFYIQDYKLCMSVHTVKAGIFIWCYINKGKNDDKLQWPLRKAVVLSIVNQKTLKTESTETFQYNTYNYDYRVAFERPLGRRNAYSIGSTTMTRYSSFSDKESIIVNDCITVGCHLEDFT